MSYVEIFYELAELKDKEDFTDYKEGSSSCLLFVVCCGDSFGSRSSGIQKQMAKVSHWEQVRGLEWGRSTNLQLAHHTPVTSTTSII
jgi:hypothetical protein